MLAVKKELPITPAEIHDFVKGVRQDVIDRIGPVGVTLSQQFWPDEPAQSIRVKFEIPKFCGRRLRDSEGNFIRNLDGFYLETHHYVLFDTNSPSHEENCWYILLFTTSKMRSASGGSYHDTKLPPCGIGEKKRLEEFDLSPAIEYLASLVECDGKVK